MSEDDPPGTAGVAPTDGAVVPDDVDDLVAFVESADAEVVTLWWRDGDVRRTTFAFDVTRVPSGAGLDDAVDVRCVVDDPPIAQPVSLASIEAVRPLSTADAVAAVLPTDSVRRAAVLRGLAARAPALVDVSLVLCLLESAEDDAAVVEALQCLSTLAEERPGDCVAAVPTVHALVVTPTTETVYAGALTCLASFASTRPEDVAPHVESVFPALESTGAPAVTAAITCVSHVASADPETVVDAADRLVDLVTDDDPTVRMHAAYALGRIAIVDPETVRPEVATLAGVVGDDAEQTATRLNATCAVGRIAGKWPDAVVEHVSTFVDALAADDAGVRANAAGVVGDVALTHAVVVRRHVASLLSCLDDEDSVTRANGSTALARVAREFPDAVCGHVDRFVDALDDDDPLVRENVCWTLGYLRDEARPARPVLERVRTDDGDERVRGRAAWALDEVGAESGVGATD